jgi:hypothetical protein
MYRLKIYSDKTYLSKKPIHCPMLVPFWGGEDSHIWFQGHGVFKQYAAEGKDYFDLVDTIEEADLVVLPSTYHRYLTDGVEHVAYTFADLAADHQKPILVFHERDWDFRFPRDNAILFSPALEKSTVGPNQFGLPGWAPTYVDDAVGVQIRQKQEKPVVGFCGWVRQPNLKGRVTQFARMHVPRFNEKRLGDNATTWYFAHRHRYLRKYVLDLLQASPRVETNFLLRERFFSGAQTRNGKQEIWNHDHRQQSNHEYVENLLSSDYVACVRGIGNYSFRFYETMGSGRLPLFIDTDCVLPYDFIIDWSKEMCWVDIREVETIAQRLADYHDNLSPLAFEDHQLTMRYLWSKWLSPTGFFQNLYRHMEHITMHQVGLSAWATTSEQGG